MLDLCREKATFNALPENAEDIPELNPDTAVTNTTTDSKKVYNTNYDETTKEIAEEAKKEAADKDVAKESLRSRNRQ